MSRHFVETSQAVAQGAKLCKPAVIPMYPITPQTHIVETLADMINNGELDSEMIHVESEHSAISAALGASATGARVFTATASQGLALMHEILHVVSGMRLPVVMAVANRALSAPINIWNDHQDSISARDTGWIQFYAESAQEAIDSVIQAYKVAENNKVLLPAMVCIDGFSLSHVYEPVDFPQVREVGRFLPKLSMPYTLDTKKPVTMGPVGFPDTFMEFKHQEQEAMDAARGVIKDVNKEFKRKFGRSYGNGLIEEYHINDAEYAIVAMGSVCGTVRSTVDSLREQGEKVGMLKIRAYRPFPGDELLEACRNLKGVGVIDKNISLGHEGAVYTEIRSLLFNRDIVVNDFIAGLGGRDITPGDIASMYKKLRRHHKPEWML